MKKISCVGLLLFSLTLTISAQSVNCLRGDCDSGHSLAVFSNGNRYEGDFAAGMPHGLGAMAFPNGDEYYGNFYRRYRHGKGRMKFSNGDHYFGDFHENEMQGIGTMHYVGGGHYEGEWFAGVPHGTGVLNTPGGDEYKGEFASGMFHGSGTMHYADGSIYQGQWQYSQKHGRGKLNERSGQVKDGWWEADQFLSEDYPTTIRDLANADTAYLRNCNLEFCMAGRGSFTYRNGTHYVGEFAKGTPKGEGKVVYTNGDKYEGGWQSHQPHGSGTMYYKSGQLVRAVWELGRPTRILEDMEARQPTDDYSTREVRIWAVIVGAAQYTHMRALRYTDDDAYQLYAHLKSPQGGALKDQQLRLLVDEAATRVGILQAMRQTFQQADENDVVIFYFSGHGIKDAFLPIDYDGSNNLLLHQEIRKEIERSRAKHKLVIGDACHSGGLAFRNTSAQEALRRYYDAFEQTNGGLALLMSSKGIEYSIEDKGLRSGVFSYYLIKGLKGAADNDASGIVSVDEIYQYVYRNVRSYTGSVQTPQLFGHFDRRMPVSATY
ncbi:MAG TPA: caspase family protein [Saprospiraceae bacterium]|nr:caspase family protein [Saprospiraceae bacterium]